MADITPSEQPNGNRPLPAGSGRNRPVKAPWWRPGRYFAMRRAIPIEQRSYTKMYSLLAIALFIFTLWAVADEVLVRRPWKDVQEDFKKFKATRLHLEIRKEKRKLNPADTMRVHREIKSAMKTMNSGAYKNSLDRIESLDKKIATAQRDYTFTKSNADEQYYYLDEDRTQRKDTTADGHKLRQLEATMRRQQQVVDSLQKLRADENAKVLPVQRQLKASQDVHDSIFATVIALQRKLDAVDVMPIAVKQTMLVNYEKTNFNNLKMRVDRCVTCHLGYDDALFKNDTLISTDAKEIKQWRKSNLYNNSHYKVVKLGPNKDTVVAMVTAVFRMHPDVGLLIKGHKVGEPSGPGVLGCTSCHAGQGGSLVSADFAHGFEHHYTQPLLTGHYIEATCQNCHSGKMDFEGAQYMSMGKKLFTDFGCYGCHNATGFEEMPGQAPSLLNVSKKLTPEWMFQWIKNPRGWAYYTRMPNFMLNDHEIQSVVAYLTQHSQGPYQPVAHGAMGDAVNGKAIFANVGCVACHSMDEYKSQTRVKEFDGFGPDLNKIGSKVTAEWVFDWIKNPKNYHPKTRMPSLRLSDQEASDLTAYLMQHHGSNDSVSSIPAFNALEANLASEGEKVIKSYGCYGCHTIEGMEKESKVSVSLTTFAKKSAGELFFGNVPAEVFGHMRTRFKKEGIPLGEMDEADVHDNQDWYTWVIGKMKNSRLYATERIPQKMPNFQMSDEESYALSVWLKSLTGDYVAPSYADQITDANVAHLSDGRMFAHWNNCVACHQIEHSGGYIAKFIEDPMYRPPLLTPEGDKVQESWLRDFLRGPTPIRPWLKIRMPTFGFSDSNIAVATKYFLATHERPFVLTDYTFALDQNLLPAGKQLFDQLKCLSCHVVGDAASGAQQIAPNLELTRKRLRPDWVISWLHNPEAIQPGTRMPAFWGTPKNGMASPFPDILAGNVEMQIHAVRDYVYSIGKPDGPGSSPYAVINGTDHYILPDGTYDVVLTNAMTSMPQNMIKTTSTPAPGGTSTSPSNTPANKPAGKHAALKSKGKRLAAR